MNQNNRNRRMIRSKTKRLAQLLNTIEILEEGEGKNNEEEIVEENEFFYEGGWRIIFSRKRGRGTRRRRRQQWRGKLGRIRG